MTSVKDRAIVVSALKHAAPYIRLFKGKVFVLKAGGEVFADPVQTRALMEQVGILHQVGIRVVLIHGGGPQSTKLATELGLDTTFVDGRRVTDGASLDVAMMVLNGQINTRVLAACRDLQIPAVGISGVDAGLIRAHRRPPVERKGADPIDYGFVGDIDSVEADILRKQLDNGLMPVISPLSCDESGTLLNINADTVAAAIAAELDARQAARRRQTRRRHAAQGGGDRCRAREWRPACARDFLQGARQPAPRGVHQRGHGHAGGERHQRVDAGGTSG